mgnify:CR=1 FL=1
MVVDDSPLFRTWLIRSLSADDRFQIVGYAVNALDAQEKIPLLQPDMLTLDIEMPGMSGIEFFKAASSGPPYTGNPGIFPEPEGFFDALGSRSCGFLCGNRMKPMDCLKRSFFLCSVSKLLVAAASHVHLPSVPASPQAAKKTDSLSFNCRQVIPFR